ncbi:MAG: alpha/beta family hydrolase [Candidatus Micrarchaeota archaeon]
MEKAEEVRTLHIPIGTMALEGLLGMPKRPKGIVIFAHGSGSSRLSPRNNYVANLLRTRGFATLLFDLLSEEEDYIYETRFNIPLLAQRLVAVTEWLMKQPEAKGMPIGYFGSSTGSAAALVAASQLGARIKAVVSRGGRPDMVIPVLSKVRSPTLLIVGGSDDVVIELNQQAYLNLQCEREMSIIPGAGHLFEEPGALEDVADQAAKWFKKYLVKRR